MYHESDLAKIESHCTELLNSPYLRRTVPPELKNLQAVLEKVGVVVREDVPSLVAEVKRLRTQNKKLTEELNTLRPTASSSQPPSPTP
jgi:hypothetical protein